MAIVVGTNSWLTLAEAESYFSTRINSTAWSGLPDNATKEKYLISAFNWIYYDPAFTAPSTADDDAVKYGQCEGALFLITYGDEYYKRDALIASGVTSFDYSKWSEDLGEIVKPAAIFNFFLAVGYYRGGIAMTILEDPSTRT